MRSKIIAELCYNHNGDISKAKELIKEAAKLKLWAVKFQKWDIEGFSDDVKNIKRNDPEHDFGNIYYEHRKSLEFSIEQLIELKEYTEKKGLVFICSGKDLFSCKQLIEELKVEWIKLPSQRYHNHDIWTYLHNKKKTHNFKVIVSTGMITGQQIKKSAWIKEADVFMHCISLYPAELRDCNIRWMKNLPYNGYSSHEVGGIAIKYAIANGAEYIERHFTLDKTDKGHDHIISSDPSDMKRIIAEIEEAELICGDGKRNITEKEIALGKHYKSF
jgi:sialic acid synthase SpsE